MERTGKKIFCWNETFKRTLRDRHFSLPTYLRSSLEPDPIHLKKGDGG